MVQSCFVECGKILKSDFTKGFSMERFVPIFAIDGDGVVVMALQKQGVGEVLLDPLNIVPKPV
jgi:hypothetical protein